MNKGSWPFFMSRVGEQGWSFGIEFTKHLYELTYDTVKPCANFIRSLGDDFDERASQWILMIASVRPLLHGPFVELCKELKPSLFDSLTRGCIYHVFKYRVLKPDRAWRRRDVGVYDPVFRRKMFDDVGFRRDCLLEFVRRLIEHECIDFEVVYEWVKRRFLRNKTFSFVCVAELCSFGDFIKSRDRELFESMVEYVKSLESPMKSEWEKCTRWAIDRRTGIYDIESPSSIEVVKFCDVIKSDDVDSFHDKIHSFESGVVSSNLPFLFDLVLICVRYHSIQCLRYLLVNYPDLCDDWDLSPEMLTTRHGLRLYLLRKISVLFGSIEIIRLLEEYKFKFPMKDNGELVHYAIVSHQNDILKWLLGSESLNYYLLISGIQANNLEFVYEFLVEPVSSFLEGIDCDDNDELFKHFRLNVNQLLNRAIQHRFYECVSWMCSLNSSTDEFNFDFCRHIKTALEYGNRPIQTCVCDFRYCRWWTFSVGDLNNLFHFAAKRGFLWMIRSLLSQNDEACVSHVVEASNSANCYGFTPADIGKLYHHEDVVEYMVGQGCLRHKSDSEVCEFRASGNDICVSPKYVYLCLARTHTDMWRTVRISLDRLISMCDSFLLTDWVVQSKCKEDGHMIDCTYPDVNEQTPKGDMFTLHWFITWFQ